MRDARVETVADILVDYSLHIAADDKVVINGAYVAEPLMLALYRRCLERGAHPMIRASIPHSQPMFYKLASDRQLEFVWETDKWLMKTPSFPIPISTNPTPRQLSRIDPGRQVIARKARKPLMETYMKRSAAGDFRWNVTLFPTDAHAMDAEMSLEEYEEFYYA